MKNNEIMLNSEFQRRFDASDKDNWIVIDGLQRLNAIKRFVLEKTLRLEGLTIMKDFNDLCFTGLDQTLQRRINEREFREATDNGISTNRMADQECVLRFLIIILASQKTICSLRDIMCCMK